MINKDKVGNWIKINDLWIDLIWKVCGRLGILVLIYFVDLKFFWDLYDENNECWLELKLCFGWK